MTYLREIQSNPFDILFKDFFNSTANFNTIFDAKSPHPVDIFEDPQGLHFEIACTGLSKEDVKLDVEGDVLKINYTRLKGDEPDSEDRNYVLKTIAKRSFNLGYKISSKFNINQAEAELINGLLHIHIPFSEISKPRSLKIK